MNKNLLLLIILLSPVLAFSQKGFHLGVSGAFSGTFILQQNNYGTLEPFQEEIVRRSEMDYRMSFGGDVGVLAGFNFSRHWGIEGGAQYALLGQRYEDNFVGPAIIPEGTFGVGGTRVNVKRVVRLGYIQIPVMIKFISGGKKRTRFFMDLGPQLGIRANAFEEVKIADNVYLPDSLAFPSDKKFRPVDFGIAWRWGVDIYITKQLYFEAGVSTYIGITDLNGKALRDLGWYNKNDLRYVQSRNASVGIMVGIHYRFLKRREDQNQ